MTAPLGLTILGATGSIGASTLDVAARHPGRYRVHALTAHTSADRLLELCRRHRPARAVLSGCAMTPGAAQRAAASPARTESAAKDRECACVISPL